MVAELDVVSDSYDFSTLVQEPCFMDADLKTIRLLEPELWERFASTLEYSMAHADLELPLLIVRKHIELVDGRDVVLCLLAMRPAVSSDGAGVLFGEVAMMPATYESYVKTFGVCAPTPRLARPVDPASESPQQRDDAHWRRLLQDDLD